MRVAYQGDPEPGPGPMAPEDTGVVEGWELGPGGERVRLVRVRWPDGSLTEHAPAERELRRLTPE